MNPRFADPEEMQQPEKQTHQKSLVDLGKEPFTITVGDIYI